MANTLTALAPIAYSAAKKVAAEPFGIINAISASFDDKGVAIGDTVKVPVAPARASSDYTPAMTVTAGADATATATDVTITANKMVSWNITGEEERRLENATADQTWFEQLLMQGMRELRNKCEIDAYTAVSVGASRAFGTAGTTPFASDLSGLTNARKILQDNGAPLVDLQFVQNTDAGLAMRNLGVLQNVYQAGSDSERRTGLFLPQSGFNISESAAITSKTKGTGASYTSNTAGYAVGATSITLITGTGTVLAGDVVTFAGDTNKYVVASGVAAPGTIVLAAPGLRQAIPAAATAMTVGNNFVANIAMERSAVVGIIRPPLIPANPTISQVLVSDAMGMTYLLVDAVGDGMRTIRLHLAWGFKTVNPEFSAIVLG
jgi:hypothetical protein